MASQGFVRVRPTHSLSLVKQYRRLLGERKFWAARPGHPQAAPELARLNSAIEALAKALPLVVPGVGLAGLRAIPFHLAVPLPGNALKRAVLAGLRKLEEPTLEELVAFILDSASIDVELHCCRQLSQRVQRVLHNLIALRGVEQGGGSSRYWLVSNVRQSAGMQ